MTTRVVDSPPTRREGPLITIAIPTYNRAELLERSVGSALSQTYQNVEVLVSDNASTDNTAEVLQSLRNPRLRVLRHAQQTSAMGNWNACVAQARGDYLVLLCDDDSIAPHFIERTVDLINSAPEIQVAIGVGSVYFAATGHESPAVVSKRYSTGIWDGTSILQEFLKGGLSVQLCTVLMRTESLRERGGFSRELPHAGDLASWVPLLLTGKVGLVNERCGTYYEHQSTLTAQMAVDVRLRDLEKLVKIITDTAARLVPDRDTRTLIELNTKRYLARHAVGYIALRRRQGERLSAVLPLIWQWRRHLVCLERSSLQNSLKALSVILLPSNLLRYIRKLQRTSERASTRHIPTTTSQG